MKTTKSKPKSLKRARMAAALSLAALALTLWMIGLDAVRAAPEAPMVGVNGASCSYATIGAAISAASDGDTVYLPSGNTYTEVLGTVSKELTFTAALSDCSAADTGTAPGQTRIDGGGGAGGTWGGLLTVALSKTVTFSHLTLENAGANYGGIAYVDPAGRLILDNAIVRYGVASTTGGGVRVYRDGALELRNGSVIHSNAVTGTQSDGGGVAVYQGAMTMTGQSQVGQRGGANVAPDDGGGILLESSTLYIDTAFVQGNAAGGLGGGIMAFGASVIELHGTAAIGGASPALSNTATSGGGVYIAGPTAGIVLHDDSVIRGNAASDEGGGVYAAGGAYVTLQDNARLRDNDADSSGGGAYLTGEDTRLNMIYGGGEIRGNEARGFAPGDGGGGAYLDRGAALYAEGAAIVSNTTGLRGGGILVGSDTAVTQTGVILNNGTLLGDNTATQGGGMYVADDAQVVVSGSRVEGNEATITGGGIRLFGDASLKLTAGSTISGNTAGQFAGGLGMYTGTASLDGAVVAGNTATAEDGGGLLVARGVLTLVNSTVAGNTAGGDGGGIHASLGGDVHLRASHGTGSGDCDPQQLPAGVYCSEVRGNEAQGWGAGMYLSESRATVVDTALLDNRGVTTGTSPGAAILVGQQARALLTNTLISGHGINENTAVHVYSDGALTSHHSTYAGNRDTPLYAVGTAAVTLTHNIIWENGDTASYQSGATLTTACNDTEAALSGPGDISTDPQFITTTRGMYRLGSGSPAIDACSSGVDHDLDARARPLDGDRDGTADYDMGAFEMPPGQVNIALPLVLRDA
jgi:hypothetical protein